MQIDTENPYNDGTTVVHYSEHYFMACNYICSNATNSIRDVCVHGSTRIHNMYTCHVIINWCVFV